MECSDIISKNYQLDKTVTQRAKGLFAVLIFIGHLYSFLGISNHTATAFFGLLGYLPVACFLGISGYGLLTSYFKRKDYIKNFFSNKWLLIFFQYVALIFIFQLYKIIIQNQSFDIKTFFLSFFIGGTVVKYGWYLQEILMFYMTFALCMKSKTCSNAKKTILLSILIVLESIAVATVFNSEIWCQSSLGFVIGLLFSLYENKIYCFFENKKFLHSIIFISNIFLLSVSILLGYTSLISHHGGFYIYLAVFLKMLSSMFFVILVFDALHYIKLFRFLDILGKYSLEIYVVQGISLTCLRNRYIYNNYVYILLTIVVEIVLVILINFLFKNIKRVYKNRKD